jgi:hypothetical protein
LTFIDSFVYFSFSAAWLQFFRSCSARKCSNSNRMIIYFCRARGLCASTNTEFFSIFNLLIKLIGKVTIFLYFLNFIFRTLNFLALLLTYFHTHLLSALNRRNRRRVLVLYLYFLFLCFVCVCRMKKNNKKFRYIVYHFTRGNFCYVKMCEKNVFCRAVVDQLPHSSFRFYINKFLIIISSVLFIISFQLNSQRNE